MSKKQSYQLLGKEGYMKKKENSRRFRLPKISISSKDLLQCEPTQPQTLCQTTSSCFSGSNRVSSNEVNLCKLKLHDTENQKTCSTFSGSNRVSSNDNALKDKPIDTTLSDVTVSVKPEKKELSNEQKYLVSRCQNAGGFVYVKKDINKQHRRRYHSLPDRLIDRQRNENDAIDINFNAIIMTYEKWEITNPTSKSSEKLNCLDNLPFGIATDEGQKYYHNDNKSQIKSDASSSSSLSNVDELLTVNSDSCLYGGFRNGIMLTRNVIHSSSEDEDNTITGECDTTGANSLNSVTNIESDFEEEVVAIDDTQDLAAKRASEIHLKDTDSQCSSQKYNVLENNAGNVDQSSENFPLTVTNNPSLRLSAADEESYDQFRLKLYSHELPQYISLVYYNEDVNKICIDVNHGCLRKAEAFINSFAEEFSELISLAEAEILKFAVFEYYGDKLEVIESGIRLYIYKRIVSKHQTCIETSNEELDPFSSNSKNNREKENCSTCPLDPHATYKASENNIASSDNIVSPIVTCNDMPRSTTDANSTCYERSLTGTLGAILQDQNNGHLYMITAKHIFYNLQESTNPNIKETLKSMLGPKIIDDCFVYVKAGSNNAFTAVSETAYAIMSDNRPTAKTCVQQPISLKGQVIFMPIIDIAALKLDTARENILNRHFRNKKGKLIQMKKYDKTDQALRLVKTVQAVGAISGKREGKIIATNVDKLYEDIYLGSNGFVIVSLDCKPFLEIGDSGCLITDLLDDADESAYAYGMLTGIMPTFTCRKTNTKYNNAAFCTRLDHGLDDLQHKFRLNLDFIKVDQTDSMPSNNDGPVGVKLEDENKILENTSINSDFISNNKRETSKLVKSNTSSMIADESENNTRNPLSGNKNWSMGKENGSKARESKMLNVDEHNIKTFDKGEEINSKCTNVQIPESHEYGKSQTGANYKGDGKSSEIKKQLNLDPLPNVSPTAQPKANNGINMNKYKTKLKQCIQKTKFSNDVDVYKKFQSIDSQLKRSTRVFGILTIGGFKNCFTWVHNRKADNLT